MVFFASFFSLSSISNEIYAQSQSFSNYDIQKSQINTFDNQKIPNQYIVIFKDNIKNPNYLINQIVKKIETSTFKDLDILNIFKSINENEHFKILIYRIKPIYERAKRIYSLNDLDNIFYYIGEQYNGTYAYGLLLADTIGRLNYYDFSFQKFGSIDIRNWRLNANARVNTSLILYNLDFIITGDLIKSSTKDPLLKYLTSIYGEEGIISSITDVIYPILAYSEYLEYIDIAKNVLEIVNALRHAQDIIKPYINTINNTYEDLSSIKSDIIYG
jgi:hypothetical protein